MLKKPTRSKHRKKHRDAGFDFSTLEHRKLFAVDFSGAAAAALDHCGMQTEVVAVADDGQASHQNDNGFQRIVNGTQTDQHPAVGIVNNGCTGTLIAPNAVLTAAHCVENMGPTDGTFEVNGQVFKTTQIVTHPDYGSRDVDLAIMILSEDVQGVTPVDLLRETPQVGQMLTIVGFGATGTGDSGHQGDFGVKHEGTTPIDKVDDVSITWNFDNNSESNTAPGDSGGPAFVTIGGKKLLAGVTSGGLKEDASIGDTSFDTRVDAFADWIDKHAGTSPDGNQGGGGNDNGGDNDGDDQSSSEGTFTSNKKVNIPANQTATVESTVDVSGLGGKIVDVNVNFDIKHTWNEDLKVTLVSPSGTRVQLMDAVGGDSQNFTNTSFDDQSGTSIQQANAPFSGVYLPAEALAKFNGEAANGKWTLEVEDTYPEDGGRIKSFSVTIKTDGTTDGGGDTDPLVELAAKVDMQYQLNQVAGQYFEDLGGQGEKWMFGKDSWVYIMPNGDLHQGGSAQLIASFDASYHADPSKLHKAGDAGLAAQVDADLGLSSNGNYYFDAGGQGEKWMAGNDAWYFILPNGQLRRGGTGELVAQFDSSYYDNPSLLHDAAQRSARIALPDSFALIDDAFSDAKDDDLNWWE